MPKPYSRDLRERVVGAADKGMTYDQIAEQFSVGRASVGRWLRRRRKKGTIQADPMGGPNNVKLDPAALSVLEELVREQPDRTLQELADLLEQKQGIRVGLTTVVRGLIKLGLRRKKKAVVASERKSERVKQLRHKFSERQREFQAERLVFLDETGIDIAMTRPYVRAARGVPVPDDVPRNRGGVVTVLGALTVCGLEVAMTVEGGTSAEVFLAFVEQVLAPILLPGDVAILDNLKFPPHMDASQALQSA